MTPNVPALIQSIGNFKDSTKAAIVDMGEQALRKCPQILVNVRFAGGVNPVEHPAVKEACARFRAGAGGHADVREPGLGLAGVFLRCRGYGAGRR